MMSQIFVDVVLQLLWSTVQMQTKKKQGGGNYIIIIINIINYPIC